MSALEKRFPFVDRTFQTQNMKDNIGHASVLILDPFTRRCRRTEVALFHYRPSVVVGES